MEAQLYLKFLLIHLLDDPTISLIPRSAESNLKLTSEAAVTKL